MRGRELVGKNIRRIRVERGVSQERLAFDANVDRSYLGGIERFDENPSVDTLDKIAAILNVGVLEFFLPIRDDENLSGLRPGRKKRD